MNSNLLSEYYVKYKHEFNGEDGHNKLLIGLKKYIKNINDDNNQLVNNNYILVDNMDINYQITP